MKNHDANSRQRRSTSPSAHTGSIPFERNQGFLGGNIMQGEMSRDPMFCFHPIPRYGEYRSPTAGSISANREHTRAESSSMSGVRAAPVSSSASAGSTSSISGGISPHGSQICRSSLKLRNRLPFQ